MKSSRPDRTYSTSFTVRILRAIGLLGALAITVWLVIAYLSMPQTVATHFGPGGQADDYGSKLSVLVLAGIMLVVSLAITGLSARPALLNYPTVITEKNAQAVYREGERLLVLTLLSMQVVYLYLARSVIGGEGSALLALGFVLVLGCVLIGNVRLVRAARTDDDVAV
ncbi:DUF1648 domain-containing protein [Brachybacterium sp. FME24]|uniref:DUF1648 domain-containing protein n=1 Tax=Brachybacterium sp. FME24 TaxID=2742605 RepID=UPI00186684EC|nr:DUF1648 domain-containing protein [Brachybacterium sp. FME24]